MVTAQQIYASRIAEVQERIASKQAKVQEIQSRFQDTLASKMEVPDVTQNDEANASQQVTGMETASGNVTQSTQDNSISSMMQSMLSMYSSSMLSSSLGSLGGDGGSGGGMGDMSSMMSMIMMMKLMEQMGSTQDTQNTQSTGNLSLDEKVELYAPLIDAIAGQYDLDPALVKGLVQAESGFQADAVSPNNAQGLMQMIPSTAEAMGVDDAFDPVDNLNGGMKYLRQQLDAFNGDMKLALAAYNCGPNRVEALGIESSGNAEQYAQLSSNVRDYVETVLRYARSFGYAR